MIIIAFSNKTSKILPKIFCRHFRHCAPIVCTGGKLVMYQFTNIRNISEIYLNNRDISILHAYGWRFVYIPVDIQNDFDPMRAYSCVDLSKRALGIHNICIQTPTALYEHIAS